MTPEQEKLLRDVHEAIVGNGPMGHKGLVSRMQDVEQYQTNDKRFKNRVAGGVAVGTPVLLAVWEYIKWKFI